MPVLSRTVGPTDLPNPSSRSTFRRFAVNVASLGSVQMANMLLPLLTVPYIVRIIGPERLGLLNFSQAYIAYFTLVINYGFETAAVRAIAPHRNDPQLVNRVFSEVMAGKALLWIVSTLAFFSLTWLAPGFRRYFWLHACTYVSCLGFVLFPVWLYQAQEALGRVAIFNLAIKVLFAASVFLLIRAPEDYLYQNLSLSLAQVLVGAVALIMAMKQFRLTFTWPSARQLLGRFRDDSALFFSSLAITLYASSTVFVLGLLSSPHSVGIFSAGSRLEGVARAFVGLALNQAFFPITAAAFGRGREAGLAMIRTAFLPLVVFLTAISIALWLVAPLFIHAFFGPAFSEAVPVLRILALLTPMIGISNLLGFHTMLNLRMDRMFFVITAVGSVVGLGLTIVLTRRFAHLGAAWAWVGTEAYIAVALYACLHWRGVRIATRDGMKTAWATLRRHIASFSSSSP